MTEGRGFLLKFESGGKDGSNTTRAVSRPPSARPVGNRLHGSGSPGSSSVVRLALGVATGAVTKGLTAALIAYPLTSLLELWSVSSLVCGLLFGPAGALGVALANLGAGFIGRTSVSHALIQSVSYLLTGLVAYSIFQRVPGLSRSLRDLRSYLGFVGAAVIGSMIIAVIGSANLLLPTMGIQGFTVGLGYWFGSSLNTLLIVAPCLLVFATWKLEPWLIRSAGGSRTGPRMPIWEDDRRRGLNRDMVIIVVMILGVTAVVSPLVHLRPDFGGWLSLLYLVPILSGSFHRGLRGGVLVASASAVVYLIASAVNTTLITTGSGHQEVLGQFVGLVILSLVGAVTGTFQQARLRAEEALVLSKRELERRHESLALVNRLADRLKRVLNVDTILSEAVEALIRLSHRPSVAIYLLDDDGSQLVMKTQHGYEPGVRAGGDTLPIEGSLSGLAIASRELLVCTDLAGDDRVEPRTREKLFAAGYESVISIPLVFEMEALGVINLSYRDRQTLAHEDLESFKTIGRTVALALANARHLARLEHLAFHDALTGLPNREGLHRHVTDLIASPGHTRSMGLVLIDIDRFKEINDALGHHIGDLLLAQIGPRIGTVLADRRHDVFHLSGDEFAILLPEVNHPAEADQSAADILEGFAAPFDVSGLGLEIEASTGYSIYPDDAPDCFELLRCANVAVNHAKRTSKKIVRYRTAYDLHTPERLALASELGRAIRTDQLVVYFQPKMSLNGDHRPLGFEALVRWNHPDLGLLPLDAFIPLAEVGELIHPLTYWVVEHSLEQLARWQRHVPGLTMAVNLSTRNLLDRSCAERLTEIITKSGVDPASVEFELTETALLIDPEAAESTLRRISATGARVVIDDFGTGYSSMTFLKRCPIHALKIDRSFISDMLTDDQSRAIVRSTIQLAEDLNLAVTAEGIEDSDTVSALTDVGCRVGQGFFFLRPSPSADIESKFDEWGLARA